MEARNGGPPMEVRRRIHSEYGVAVLLSSPQAYKLAEHA